MFTATKIAAGVFVTLSMFCTGACAQFENAPDRLDEVPERFRDELDFTPKGDQRALFSAADFKFPFTAVSAQSDNGKFFPGVLANTPVLGTFAPGQAIAQVKVEFEPCGTYPAHVHPRGSEFDYVLEGEIEVAFIEDDTGRLIQNRVKEGETAFLPIGVLHYVRNPTCKKAVWLASLPNGDPGTSYFTDFFKFDTDAILANFGAGANPGLVKRLQRIVNDPRNKVPTADPKCLAACRNE